ncbi:DUF397 domain-containing protein [Nocardiopsis sp. NPDC006938]|uniref:DUF397 domain-containing protein n=1 Tax=Nocardiopsis sp. NPDC006938 TaxID=3364337 RepID=UPI00368C3E59
MSTHTSTPAALVFRTSSYSGSAGNCVEVADLAGVSAVRDTQNRSLGHILFPGREWAALLSTARTEE